ncbi:uncharacterized protein CANTADRAFT_24796 [Suhomyces tanzawaensis NRRL Y-17324]|uniref:Uncharacterized protein n=1 Tax=Suhomyces tanzawaensis NRRL Y-17324 TaxID=984487 RepID=A0A1E4SRM8_9ASCO|nr:uncharacterized protein CANTADRAFT_24796 [Suhomyces tanzawaensis NRRL Y-17324]ODV82154.1 hypothetical protein CANTADRAFT_24796 [Suhomyces tanzawaensis NRRL Y-17324]
MSSCCLTPKTLGTKLSPLQIGQYASAEVKLNRQAIDFEEHLLFSETTSRGSSTKRTCHCN